MIQELANYTSVRPILPLAKVRFFKNPATGEVTIHKLRPYERNGETHTH
jgi:hypothetical protein